VSRLRPAMANDNRKKESKKRNRARRGRPARYKKKDNTFTPWVQGKLLGSTQGMWGPIDEKGKREKGNVAAHNSPTAVGNRGSYQARAKNE